MGELLDPRDAVAYIEDALQEVDVGGFLHEPRTVVEVQRIVEITRKAGIGCESRYKTLSEDGNLKLHTLTVLLYSLGLRLTVNPENSKQSAAHS